MDQGEGDAPEQDRRRRAEAAEQSPQQQPPEQELLGDGREDDDRDRSEDLRGGPECWIARTTSCLGSLPATASIAATMPSAATWSSTPAASQGQSRIRTVSPRSARRLPRPRVTTKARSSRTVSTALPAVMTAMSMASLR